MSRTKKTKAPGTGCKPRKMKAYKADTKGYDGKFTPDNRNHDAMSDQSSPTAHEKLVTKNANRSKKKGARQKAKKELTELLTENEI